MIRGLALVAVSLLAQGGHSGEPLKDAKLRFGQSATRAVANFHSADGIARQLAAEGMTLHPGLIVLRLRIEAALDRAEAALAREDAEVFNESLRRADALIDRFSQGIGGA
jgi:hypothetical protein